MKNKLIYCNNAASSWPKPAEVLEAVQESLKCPYFERGRSSIEGLQDYLGLARESLATFFNCPDPDHVIFTQNATDSLNMLIHGFCNNTDEPVHVLTSELEHNSVLRPLSTLESKGKVSLSIVPAEGGYISKESVEDLLLPETKLAVFTHGSNVLGTIQNIEKTGKMLHNNSVFFIVDGAQTAGMVPVDFNRLPVDAFVFTGHKYLFGLPGTGGFLIKDYKQIEPVRQGGTGTDSGNLKHPEEMPERFEAGTHNYPGIVSLWAGTRYITSQGPDKIHNHCKKLTHFIIDELKDYENITLDNPDPDLPVISLSIESLGCDDVGYILLKKYSVIVRTGLHCAPLLHKKLNESKGTTRISLSFLNTPEECCFISRAVKEIAKRAH